MDDDDDESHEKNNDGNDDGHTSPNRIPVVDFPTLTFTRHRHATHNLRSSTSDGYPILDLAIMVVATEQMMIR